MIEIFPLIVLLALLKYYRLPVIFKHIFHKLKYRKSKISFIMRIQLSEMNI